MALEINTDQSNYIKTELNLSENKTENTKNETPKKVSVDEYLSQLNEKFSFLKPKSSISGVPTTVSISSEYLKKCTNDPEFAKEVEWNLSGEAAANSLIHGWAKRDGIEIVGRTVTYDADGNRESSCGMRTANTNNKGIGIDTKKFQNKYKKDEENLLNARKKEWEEKLEELREKNKEKYNELVEKIKDGSYDNKLEEFELKVYGTDIDSIIKQIEEKYEAGLPNGGSISSWDVKV